MNSQRRGWYHANRVALHSGAQPKEEKGVIDMFGKTTPLAPSEDYLYALYDNFAHNLLHHSGRPLPNFRADIVDEGDAYVLEADLPGFKKDQIKLELKDHTLTLSAVRPAESRGCGIYVLQERRMDSFSRSFEISGTDEEKISAALEDGVLRVTMPKLQPTGTGRQIAIL